MGVVSIYLDRIVTLVWMMLTNVVMCMEMRLIVSRFVYSGAQVVVVGVIQILSMLGVIPMGRIIAKLRKLSDNVRALRVDAMKPTKQAPMAVVDLAGVVEAEGVVLMRSVRANHV